MIDELYRKARDGDSRDEERLMEYLRVRFLHFARRKGVRPDDIEDVVGDALTAILNKYKTTKYTTSFSAYVWGVMNNHIKKYFDTLGKGIKRFSQFDDDTQYSNLPRKGAGDFNDTEKIRKCFQQLIKEHKRYARILNLVQLGYTTEEICHKMKITPNNSYQILNRAREWMKKCLNKKGD